MVVDRRKFVGACAGAALSACSHARLNLDEATIAASSQYSARSLVEEYLARIEETDQKGPGLHAVIEVNPDARQIADALDRERRAGRIRGRLHGIPILLKDNIDTADRMSTSAGSLALAGSPAKHDAFLVRRLRAAGAVILGKSNLSEWANFRSTHSTSGWSARGGLTRNPYALNRNPCGSSSGSAVAVAANLCMLAVGTETDGSIICPASVNGIVGIKPTLGLISRSGIIPIAHSQDTAGPMARTVRDAAILLGAMMGVDQQDPATLERQGRLISEYTQFLRADGLRGARLGVARKFFGANQLVDDLMESALQVMARQGAELVDPADLPTHGQFGDSEMEVLLYEFKADLNAYLSRREADAPVHTLTDIIDFNERNRSSEMPYFGQELMLRANAKGPLTSREYLEALQKNRQLSRTEGIDAVLAKHRLDAIVSPSSGPAWLTDLVNGDHDVGGCTSPAAVAGYPHITVPAGQIVGLPVGISFFGGAYSEPVLIRLAYAFEQATKARRTPRFLPTISTI